MPALQKLLSVPVRSDDAVEEQARRRLDALTKPPGSLGRLEELLVRLCATQGRCPPSLRDPVIFTLAGDHGVVSQGVSAYPQVVTAQMVENFLNGGAAVNVLARLAGARVVVADLGVAAPLPAHPALRRHPVGAGTQDMTLGSAMTSAQARQAVEAGIALVDEERGQGIDLVATGEMGIGNTTAASALVAALTGAAPERVTGPGTGVDGDGRRRKVEAVRRALEVNRPDAANPLETLAKLGGFEIAGLVGVILAGAVYRLPVVLDGFIAGAAALVAARLKPDIRGALIAAHRSSEPGHSIVLDTLGLEPYLDLQMRLGEGTGAALCIGLARAASAVFTEMATFKSAGVSDRAHPLGSP
jgi:nicotinate-nucleotide--dimethylbenzimidazole phosphoribosyltransferase